MKRVLFRVHGSPAQRLNFYGTVLLLLGAVLTFITTELVGLSVVCLGGWLSWLALRLGYNEKCQWMRPFLLILNIGLSNGIIVMSMRKVFGW